MSRSRDVVKDMNRSFLDLKIAGLLFSIVFVLLGVAGCLRYGGPSGVAERVQREIGDRLAPPREHPNSVPTPLPITPNPAAIDATPLLTDTIAVATPVPTSPPIEEPTAATSLPTIPSKPLPTSTPWLIPSTVALEGIQHSWQTWNNCGPATLAMQMSYFGNTLDQAAVGSVLRTYEDDKNVSPQELAAFAQGQGYQTRVLENGNSGRLKQLLSSGVPVLIETWLEEEPNDGMGHYRLLTGYDDANQHWIAYDSYVSHNLLNPDTDNYPAGYQGITLPYVEMDALWKVFNRLHVIIYPSESAALVESILAGDASEATMWQRSLDSAKTALDVDPSDAFSWFNLGSSLVAQGRYAEAAAAYDQARQNGLPWRMLWYQFEPFEAYYQTGRYQEVVALADATISTTESIEELYYWKGQGLAALGDQNGARVAFQRAVELNPQFGLAVEALNSIPSS